MLATLIIVFREVLEAGLIIGIVLAATEGVSRRGRWIAGGIFGGVSGAALLAAFAGAVANAFSGSGQELFNAATAQGGGAWDHSAMVRVLELLARHEIGQKR